MREAVGQLTSHVDYELKSVVTSNLGRHAGMPQALADLSEQLSGLGKRLQAESAIEVPLSVPDKHAPVLATVAAYYRRRFVADLERQRARAVADELLQNIDAARAVVDDLLKADWYRTARPLRLPRLRDFLAQDSVDAQQQPLALPPRRLDDKFGILWSASHLLTDLQEMRNECGERFAPMAIGFVDVDDLKALNTALGETWVDALIFPPLMRSIERAVYGHGYGYRYGGDEFVVLIPSVDETVATAIVERLRSDLRRTDFETLNKPLTISAGLCIVHPDSPVTDREALHWTVLAKKEAKTRRDTVAVVHADREIDPSGIKLLDVQREA